MNQCPVGFSYNATLNKCERVLDHDMRPFAKYDRNYVPPKTSKNTATELYNDMIAASEAHKDAMVKQTEAMNEYYLASQQIRDDIKDFNENEGGISDNESGYNDAVNDSYAKA